MKITIEPSDPHGPMGQGHPRIQVDTLFDGATIDETFTAMRAAVVAYGFAEQTFNDYCREYAYILALADGN